jgi:hypothetical protein
MIRLISYFLLHDLGSKLSTALKWPKLFLSLCFQNLVNPFSLIVYTLLTGSQVLQFKFMDLIQPPRRLLN